MTNLFTNDNPWLMIRPIQPWQTIKSLPPWETIAVMHHHNHFSHTTLDETLPSCVLDKPSHPNHLWQNISPSPPMFNHFTHSTHDRQTISLMLPKKNHCVIVPHDKQVDLCYHEKPLQSYHRDKAFHPCYPLQTVSLIYSRPAMKPILP